MIEYWEKYGIDKKTKDSWSVFIVENNNITRESWISSLSNQYYAIFIYSGHIENDTTFRFTETYYSETNETKQIDMVYHFKQFANKPDSTNVYIK
jgi:hypothetical protein